MNWDVANGPESAREEIWVRWAGPIIERPTNSQPKTKLLSDHTIRLQSMISQYAHFKFLGRFRVEILFVYNFWQLIIIYF